MQTPILPVQSSSNIAAQQAKAGPSAGAADGVDFQSALTRQIEQRQAQNRGGQAPAPMPARNTAPAPHRPAAAAAQLPPKPAPQQQAGAATPAPAQPQAKAAPAPAPASAQKPAQADKADVDKDVAAEAGASNAAPATAAAPQAPADAAAATPANAAEDAYTGPVADMLALVASLNLSVAPPPSTEVIDSQTAAGTGVLPADAGVKPAADAPAKAGLADQGAGATATAFAAVADAAKAGVAAAGKFASATTATASTAPAADARGAADTLLPAAQLAAQPGAPAPQAQASDPAAAQLAAVKTRDGLPELQLIQEPPREAATLAAAPVQQASLQITEAATSVPGAVLRGQVGTPAWNQELGQKIVWMVAGAEQSATLTLNPPDLGPLQVVLRVSNDQLDATFTSAQPEVRQALEAALPRLREMMSATGVELANASVSAGLSNQQNGGNGEARMGRGGGGGGGGGSHGGGGGDGNGGLERGGAAAPRKVAQGMVDTFA